MRNTWRSLLTFGLAALVLFGMNRTFASRAFTGSSQYLSVSGSSVNVSGTQLTLATWVKYLSFQNYSVLFAKEVYGTAFQYILGNSTATSGVPLLRIGSGTTSATLTCSSALSLNTWYHVAATVNGTAMTVYVNGAVSCGSAGGIAIGSTTNVLCLGNGSGAVCSTTSGANVQMAEAAIWNVALTANEIKALANCTPPPIAHGGSSLVGYWPLWGIDSPEGDYSGNKSSATVTGATRANHVCGGPWNDR